MPLPTRLVGNTSTPVEHVVDARWLMAYAAGLGDVDACYQDTNANIACHPLFPVCLEWPAILAGRAATEGSELTSEEAARAVHAGHDLHWRAPIQPDSVLTTTSTIVGVRASRAGAISTMRLDTIDAHGALVCQTWQTSVYRGVETLGEDRSIADAPALPVFQQDTAADTSVLSVSAEAAHIYTECARIWNPIHTDRAVAKAAGLPDIILHGTATLAMAVSAVVRAYASGNPARVSRIGGEFRGQVLMPCDLILSSHPQSDALVTFNVSISGSEQLAIRNGFVELTI